MKVATEVKISTTSGDTTYSYISRLVQDNPLRGTRAEDILSLL